MPRISENMMKFAKSELLESSHSQRVNTDIIKTLEQASVTLADLLIMLNNHKLELGRWFAKTLSKLLKDNDVFYPRKELDESTKEALSLLYRAYLDISRALRILKAHWG